MQGRWVVGVNVGGGIGRINDLFSVEKKGGKTEEESQCFFSPVTKGVGAKRQGARFESCCAGKSEWF
jgi:hypothetical protein